MANLSHSLKLRIRPHAGQRQVLASEDFCTAAIAGTGGGKTVVGMVKLVMEMARSPGKLWIVAEPTLDMVDRVLLTSTPGRPSLVDFMEKFDPDQVYLKSKRTLYHKLGTVVFASGDRPDSFQGQHIGGIWLDEAGLMKYDTWLTAVQRVGYEGGKILLTTTPYNMGWLKTEVYDRWREGDEDYSVVQFASTANPKFPKEAMERARRTMSPERFRMLYEGQFGRPEGMIYDCFDPTLHLVDDFRVPDDWERLGGLDFGFNNPTAAVFLARDHDGVYYWYDEHYLREQTLSVHADLLKAKGGDKITWYGDPSAPQQQQELRRGGISVVDGDNDVLAGIDTVYAIIASGRLKIFRSIKHGVDELESYVWKRGEGQFKDEPVKEHDHLMDALRYVLHTTEKGVRLGLTV